MHKLSQSAARGGYTTAYVGKYHMGEGNDEPRPGFDYFVTHKGQGKYFGTEFNINGERREVRNDYYTTAVTDIALDWLQRDHGGKPWLMILGHKAAHSFYTPEAKYEHAFDGVKVPYPESAFSLDDKPAWIKDRLSTWHGIYGPLFEWRKKFPDARPEAVTDFENMVHAYWSTILSVDDSVGRLRAWLEKSGQLDNTIIVFVGDNGLLEGEHGMVDKRTMHEPSIRIPMAVRYAGLTKTPRVIDQQVLTVDMAPSLLELAGAAASRWHGWTVLGPARSRRQRPGLAEELVLLLQLREGIPVHAECAGHPHRGMEVRPLPAWRRIRRQASGRALRSQEGSGRALQPHSTSGLQRHRSAAADRAERADGRDRAHAADRQDAARRGDQERAAGAEHPVS